MVPSVALLSSPLLGPSVWQPVAQVLADRGWHTVMCAASAPIRTGQDVLDAFLAALPIDREFVLVPHSNAGAYVPALTMQRRIVAAVFVDAVLPPGSGRVPLAPPAFLDLLREKADGSGLLPVWTSWWDEAEVAALFPNAETRTRLEREQQRLPLSYFEDRSRSRKDGTTAQGRTSPSATPTGVSGTKPSGGGGRSAPCQPNTFIC